MSAFGIGAAANRLASVLVVFFVLGSTNDAVPLRVHWFRPILAVSLGCAQLFYTDHRRWLGPETVHLHEVYVARTRSLAHGIGLLLVALAAGMGSGVLGGPSSGEASFVAAIGIFTYVRTLLAFEQVRVAAAGRSGIYAVTSVGPVVVAIATSWFSPSAEQVLLVLSAGIVVATLFLRRAHTRNEAHASGIFGWLSGLAGSLPTSVVRLDFHAGTSAGHRDQLLARLGETGRGIGVHLGRTTFGTVREVLATSDLLIATAARLDGVRRHDLRDAAELRAFVATEIPEGSPIESEDISPWRVPEHTQQALEGSWLVELEEGTRRSRGTLPDTTPEAYERWLRRALVEAKGIRTRSREPEDVMVFAPRGAIRSILVCPRSIDPERRAAARRSLFRASLLASLEKAN
jgi:hypothetical protein